MSPSEKNRRIRYWCGDESRFGLQTIPGKLITLKGVKPIGLTQWKRDNFYLYGVVEPMSGENFILEFSHLDTMCFQIFLEKFAVEYPEDLHIIQVDNGAFHFSNYLKVPSNIILLFQPAHSPEVNPIERFWEEIKKHLSWECFQTLNELQEAVWKQLSKFTTSQVKSIAGWDFIINALFVSGFS
ncbi:IS630 family transposase [Brasilonema bromeliae SPC951]|uniref:IS630 family transposase n=1 Tax=Brasilonema bromeliae SPC951 TaxID=385972 RepID=A0ABX1PCS3_9CYAN|nr:IS630 family transposase [Brasilonema bromeliae SPC951]